MFESITPLGNPVNQKLHEQFQTDLINKQSNGEPGWDNYDSWYEDVIKRQSGYQTGHTSMRGTRGFRV